MNISGGWGQVESSFCSAVSTNPENLVGGCTDAFCGVAVLKSCSANLSPSIVTPASTQKICQENTKTFFHTAEVYI